MNTRVIMDGKTMDWNMQRRRKKRLRNLVCIVYCMIQLAVVLGAFWGMDKLLARIVPASIDLSAIEGSIVVLDGDGDSLDEDKLTVCVDAGHGGKDNGSDYRLRYEKNDNLKIAQAVASYLTGQGVQVIMTRTDDTFLSLEERTEFANQNGADYLISLHRNTGDGNGVETWIYSNADEETNALAANIMDNLDAAGIQRNRGVKQGTQNSDSGDYYINLHSDMPSCIVELGFMNSTADNQLFDANLSDYAKAIGDAVLTTYEAYGESGAQADTEAATETGGTEQTGGAGNANMGQVLQNTVIENVDALDASSKEWGQGTNVDEKNRPTGALLYQEQYGKYNAYFIGEESRNIYLTFDEGYEYGQTESILNTLKEKGVSATFFITESYAKSNPELVRRMIDEGHVVGNHSVTHPAAGLPSLSAEQQKNEVTGNHAYVKENFGYDMYLFRYPTGRFSEQSLAIVNNCNYKSIFWSFAYLDYDVENQPDEAESLGKLKDRLHPGAIYLLHAESETNAAILGDFIDAVRAAGYGFLNF